MLDPRSNGPKVRRPERGTVRRRPPVHRGRVVVTFHDQDRLQVLIAGPYTGQPEAVNTNLNAIVSDPLNVQNRRASPIESVRSNPL